MTSITAGYIVHDNEGVIRHYGAKGTSLALLPPGRNAI